MIQPGNGANCGNPSEYRLLEEKNKKKGKCRDKAANDDDDDDDAQYEKCTNLHPFGTSTKDRFDEGCLGGDHELISLSRFASNASVTDNYNRIHKQTKKIRTYDKIGNTDIDNRSEQLGLFREKSLTLTGIPLIRKRYNQLSLGIAKNFTFSDKRESKVQLRMPKTRMTKVDLLNANPPSSSVATSNSSLNFALAGSTPPPVRRSFTYWASIPIKKYYINQRRLRATRKEEKSSIQQNYVHGGARGIVNGIIPICSLSRQGEESTGSCSGLSEPEYSQNARSLRNLRDAGNARNEGDTRVVFSSENSSSVGSGTSMDSSNKSAKSSLTTLSRSSKGSVSKKESLAKLAKHNSISNKSNPGLARAVEKHWFRGSSNRLLVKVREIRMTAAGGSKNGTKKSTLNTSNNTNNMMMVMTPNMSTNVKNSPSTNVNTSNSYMTTKMATKISKATKATKAAKTLCRVQSRKGFWARCSDFDAFRKKKMSS